MKQILLQPAYVLHRRPYRETSYLIDLFTREHGRMTVVARGVRKAKSSSQGLLQPFVSLMVSWTGKGELMTLSHVEPYGEVIQLRGDSLFAGFYLNELLMGLLEKWDAHPALYDRYACAVAQLQTGLEQQHLRSFEKFLLEELGYGLLPAAPAALEAMFVPERYYRFVPEHGFVLSELGDQSQAKSNIFSGKHLIAIAKEDWQGEEVIQDAKRLMRLVLVPLLGRRQIHSRKLFAKAGE